jgi:hypothetical protein
MGAEASVSAKVVTQGHTRESSDAEAGTKGSAYAVRIGLSNDDFVLGLSERKLPHPWEIPTHSP